MEMCSGLPLIGPPLFLWVICSCLWQFIIIFLKVWGFLPLVCTRRNSLHTSVWLLVWQVCETLILNGVPSRDMAWWCICGDQTHSCLLCMAWQSSWIKNIRNEEQVMHVHIRVCTAIRVVKLRPWENSPFFSQLFISLQDEGEISVH